jgi:hypothetical protein
MQLTSNNRAIVGIICTFPCYMVAYFTSFLTSSIARQSPMSLFTFYANYLLQLKSRWKQQENKEMSKMILKRHFSSIVCSDKNTKLVLTRVTFWSLIAPGTFTFWFMTNFIFLTVGIAHPRLECLYNWSCNRCRIFQVHKKIHHSELGFLCLYCFHPDVKHLNSGIVLWNCLHPWEHFPCRQLHKISPIKRTFSEV